MSERRAAVLLGTILVAQLALLTSQVSDTESGASLLEVSFLRVTGPVARWVTGSVERTNALSSRVRTMKSLRQENVELHAEVERLRAERARLQGLEEQLDLLQEAVDYVPPVQGELVVADVVLVDHHSFRRSLVAYLPVGTGADVGLGSPVTTEAGLVGRVFARAGSYVRVQLVTDRASSVGAMISRTRRQGIVRGEEGGVLSLDYVPLQASVEPGDRIVTAGIDGVYPRGIDVGTVISVEEGGELFHRVRLLPAVDFGLLSQVYVLGRGDGLPMQAEDAVP